MAFVAQDVIDTVQPILQDNAGVRWPESELLDHINEALRVIALEKPNALSETVTVELAAGAKQSLPAGYHRLLRPIRNIANGRAVRMADEETLNAHFPRWQDTDFIPASPTVINICEDTMDTSVFYVFPCNDGTGEIEAILAKMPNDVPTVAAAVPIGDIYRQAICDYTLYRAFSKDTNVPSIAQRAQTHYQYFQKALGLRSQIEVSQSPEAPHSRHSR